MSTIQKSAKRLNENHKLPCKTKRRSPAPSPLRKESSSEITIIGYNKYDYSKLR